MLKITYVIFLFLTVSIYCYCQSSDSLLYSGNYSIKVDSVKLTGNNITQKDVIIRELTFGIGDTVNSKILNYNSERVYSLGIFTIVTLIAYRVNQCNYILISVDESWYIYPIPFINFEDRDWGKNCLWFKFFF